ncbi:MAG TPA: DUF2950 domain-containing protein [Ottowia sp.]|nr:DUF2950 domain-containing protein [Ottowia sp.]
MMNSTNAHKALKLAIGALAVSGALAYSTPVLAQKAFPTPSEAAEALVDGLARNDGDQVKTVLGDGYARYIPPESADYADRIKFLEAWSRGHKIVQQGDDKAALEVGTHGWTLPIPLVKSATGWRFDIRQTPHELQVRRIGRNELAAIQTVLAVTDAQEEFYQANPDGLPVKHFAMRALSTPGKRDGLYWPSAPGVPDSPLGPAFADARRGQAYHGYRYKVLTEQGKNAPGGAKSYVRNGLMTEGFALVAWPEHYGDSGVMTFIVNRDGQVHQKNLGRNSDAAARRMKAYDPDPSWEKVEPPK